MKKSALVGFAVGLALGTATAAAGSSPFFCWKCGYLTMKQFLGSPEPLLQVGYMAGLADALTQMEIILEGSGVEIPGWLKTDMACLGEKGSLGQLTAWAKRQMTSYSAADRAQYDASAAILYRACQP